MTITQKDYIRRVAEVLPARTGKHFFKIVGRQNVERLFVYMKVKSTLEDSGEKFLQQLRLFEQKLRREHFQKMVNSEFFEIKEKPKKDRA